MIIYIYMYDTHLNISQSKGRHSNPSRLHFSASCFTSVTRGERTESLGKWYPVWARLGFALMISAVGLPSGDRRDGMISTGTWHRTGEGRECHPWGDDPGVEALFDQEILWKLGALALATRARWTWYVRMVVFRYSPCRCQRPVYFIILYWICEVLGVTLDFTTQETCNLSHGTIQWQEKLGTDHEETLGISLTSSLIRKNTYSARKKNKEGAHGGDNKCDLTAFYWGTDRA